MPALAIRFAVGDVYPSEGARIAFVWSHLDGRIRPDVKVLGALLAVLSPSAPAAVRCPIADDLWRIDVR
jgi:hypothetical protein